MPIKIDRVLELLTAAEDALQALERVEKEIADAWARVQVGGASPDSSLESLSITVKKEFLLAKPVETVTAIRVARQFYSPERLRKNQRSRARMRRSRQQADQWGG